MSQSESSPLVSDDNQSRSTTRAEAALTHPATLVALATLLVNDLVFKSMWPGSWITGKLSDLAWVIFAPPLIALPLTFLARRNQTAQNLAWATAYIGLPLLYAAYNTFEPLHDLIMGAFSILRGTSGGSPFDPTDSIVIPFGIAIAIWVWRTARVNNAAIKVKSSLFIAVLASVASVATSVSEPPTGASLLGEDQNGDVVAKDLRERDWMGDFFRSRDGGFTWESAREDLLEDESIDWNALSAVTPEGEYTLDGSNVIRTGDGVIHSTLIVNSQADYRIFALATKSKGPGYGRVTHLPTDIHYDAKSGNLIVAMGLQGVLVRTSDHNWHRVAVGPYTPVDFSPLNRVRLVMAPSQLLFSAFALALAAVAFALVVSTWPIEAEGKRYIAASLTAAIGMVVMVPLIVAGLISSFSATQGISGDLFAGEGLSAISMLLSALLVIALIFAVLVVTRRAFHVPFSVVASTSITLILLGASVVPLSTFSETNSLYGYEDVAPTLAAIMIGLVSIGLIIAKLVNFTSRRTTMAVILTASAMMSVIALMFFIWVSGMIDLSLAKIASVALVWTIAAILYTYARRIWRIKHETNCQNAQDGRRQPIYPEHLSENEDHD